MSVRAELVEKRKELEAKQDRLGKIFSEAGPEIDLAKVTVITGTNEEKAAEVKRINDECTPLAIEVERLAGLVEMEKAAKGFASPQSPTMPGRNGDESEAAKSGASATQKSLGQLIAESPGAQSKGVVSEIELKGGIKTLFSTSAGWAPQAVRAPRVVDYPVEPLGLLDFIPSIPTTQNAYLYMEETTFTNAAAGVAEDGEKPESALALTERTAGVKKIATILPVTDEQLADIPGASAYLDARLGFMVKDKLEGEIVAGSGGNSLTGILNTSNVQTQAKGADPTPDAVYKAMTKVRVTGKAMANVAVFHPNDWQDIRLLRTADGIYIWGNPSDAGPERIWGLNVVQVTRMTENTALVGDTRYVLLIERQGLQVDRTNSNEDDFKFNRWLLRAEVRAALAVLRPTAWAKVTGI